MMDVTSNNFVALSEIAVHDSEQQTAVKHGTLHAYNKRLSAMFADGHEHGEAMRQQAAQIKRRALSKLPDLLQQAEKNMQANGIEVLWAVDAAEANRHVLNIARRHHAKSVIKSKSMLAEELGLNHALEDSDLEVVETDLGEFIVQIAGETPSHIVAPVIHKTRDSIRDLFVDELGMSPTDDAGEMVFFARQYLRDIFINADIGITGGNFIIAESGTLGLVMNEGNGRMVTSLPRVHIALVGIEKVIESTEDYATMTQVLPRSSTGQNMTVYTNMINGPRRVGDPDGPEHVYVILVDNGRSDIYETAYVEALACIRCGACLNACPVYRSTGGHAYGWVYGGPIGAVLTPLFTGLENAKPLPHASSLCGSCKQVCPVDIDLPRMLLDLRHDLIEQGHGEVLWNIGLKSWEIGNTSPRLFEMGGIVARFGQQWVVGDVLPGPLGNWTAYRDFPDFAEKPFRQQWRERQKGNHSE